MNGYSVLMSVYEKEKTEHLIQSIESMLRQTVRTDDFVLVCDGPLTSELEQEVARFCKAYPGLFQIVRLKKNLGLGKALNAGLEVCRHELVARMDSDDISVERRCQWQVALFEEHPELTIVSGTAAEFEKDPEHPVSFRRLPEQHEEILRYAQLRNPFNHPAVMYRKSAVLEAGGYQDAPLHEDYDLWVRILKRGGQGYNLPQIVCCMRVDDGLYKRRGGLRYLKAIAGFHRKLYRERFCTWKQYAASVAAYTVSCLLPPPVRRGLYQQILRKQ